MTLEIHEQPVTLETLTGYGTVSIAFEVGTILDVEHAGLGGINLVEKPVETPWLKDYDAIRGEGPTRWAKRWDMANWGLLVARDGRERVGGAVLAGRTEGVDMLEGRDDLAVLWDLRVAPDHRGRGVGTRLFDASVRWAEDHGCRDLKVETQNINVPACRFYAARGCTLGAVSRFAYPECPDEIMMLWYRPLSP